MLLDLIINATGMNSPILRRKESLEKIPILPFNNSAPPNKNKRPPEPNKRRSFFTVEPATALKLISNLRPFNSHSISFS